MQGIPMPVLHLNRDQKLELSKAFFNFGNIIGGTVIVNQAVFGTLTSGTFIFGFICFTILFSIGTVILKTERKRL